MLAFDRTAPRFDGTLTLSRPAVSVLASGRATANEPWRLSSKVEGHHRGGHAGRGVVPVRPGGARRDARRRGGVHVRPASAVAGNAVGAAGGSRPAAGRARRGQAAAAFGGAGVRRHARRRAPAVMAGAACAEGRRDDGRRRHGAGRRQRCCVRTAPPGRSTSSSSRAPGFTHVKIDGRLFALGKGLGFVGGASVDSNDPENSSRLARRRSSDRRRRSSRGTRSAM